MCALGVAALVGYAKGKNEEIAQMKRDVRNREEQAEALRKRNAFLESDFRKRNQ